MISDTKRAALVDPTHLPKRQFVGRAAHRGRQNENAFWATSSLDQRPYYALFRIVKQW